MAPSGATVVVAQAPELGKIQVEEFPATFNSLGLEGYSVLTVLQGRQMAHPPGPGGEAHIVPSDSHRNEGKVAVVYPHVRGQ